MIRKLIPGALALGLIATSSAQTPDAAPKQEATTPAVEVPAKPKLDPAVIKSDSSYALGFRTGGGFTQQFGKFGVGADDLDMENFIKGFSAAIKGGKPELEEAKLQAAMEALGEMLQVREKETAAANLAAGKKFLEENGKRAGVTTTRFVHFGVGWRVPLVWGADRSVRGVLGAQRWIRGVEPAPGLVCLGVHRRGPLVRSPGRWDGVMLGGQPDR